MIDQAKDSRRTCDIVMKGGLTSGVVYPKAIVRLSTRFTFKNLGGTSAGAIAASAAAAAESRRIRTGQNAGFTLLDGLGDFLTETPQGASGTRLLSFFRPNAGTRRVFAVLLASLEKDSLRAALLAMAQKAFRLYREPALAGAFPGAILAGFGVWQFEKGAIAWVSILVGLALALAGGLAGMVFSLGREFVRELPRNNFGLCSGMPDNPSAGLVAEPLTIWLTRYLNEVAGFAPGHRPLVFGDLWNPTGKAGQGPGREVNLEMMTTNLTHGRPYRLPFRDDQDLRENHLFFFHEDEFSRLFPAEVVKWMIENPRPLPETPAKRDLEISFREWIGTKGFHCLPAPENLPVIVATRMSLSFPILLSAVPLHGIDRSVPREQQTPERCWFTDGGLCSNLPLHFFDSPIPRRPTFSIDLTQKPDDTPLSELNPEMDDQNVSEPLDRWNRFDLVVSALGKDPVEKRDLEKITGFVMAMITTMQNWNDATAARLPGFRDRIVRIPMTSKQGGLNLTMPEPRVTFLTGQGEKSADVLMKHFDVPASHDTMNWENHRWIRIRSMLAALEKMVEQTVTTCNQPENGDISYEDWLKALLADTTGKYKDLSYTPTKKQIQAALDTLAKVREIQATWITAGGAADRAPKPRPILRPRPQI